MAKATRNQPIGPAAKDNARSQLLPDNLDTALKEKLEEAISSVIGQGQRAQVVDRVTQVVASEIFTGPVPHPRHVAEYEKICPGLADRMMAMAEKAQEKHELRKDRILELAYTERKNWLNTLILGVSYPSCWSCRYVNIWLSNYWRGLVNSRDPWSCNNSIHPRQKQKLHWEIIIKAMRPIWRLGLCRALPRSRA